MATIQQFDFFTLDPNISVDNLIPITSTPLVIAELTIDEVVKGDIVWLNGVVGVDNDNETAFASLDIRIFKGNVYIPGREIYYAVQEVDKENEADVVNVPISHVDVIKSNETNVKYVLTIQETENIKNVFVDGPITFTAARIRPQNS